VAGWISFRAAFGSLSDRRHHREDKAKQAEINRVRHGRTQAQKDRERADRERAARMLEGKRLEGAGEDVSDGGSPEPAEPSNERP
jgi:hypothetical protein